MARTRLEVWKVERYDQEKHGRTPPKPVLMNPPPVGAVDGSLSSDDAKRNATKALADLGFAVRSVNASPENKLVCYVWDDPPKPKRENRKAGVKPAVR